MKKSFRSIMFIAAAAMAFASCQKEENVAPETISATLTMHANVDATKTYLGDDNTVLWGTGETVQLYVGVGETSKFVSSASTDAYDGEASASFSFAIEGVEATGPYSLGGIYPASVVVTSSNTNPAKYKVQLPATQQSVDGNYDPAAYIMVLKPESVDVLPSEYTASFRRATALNKITLTNVEEDVTSVEITVPEGKYLAGRRNFDLTAGESGEIYDSGSQTNVVKVTGDFKAGNVDVWFCSWGVDIVENETLTVKVTSATKSYTRSITVRAEGIKFHEGDLNTLTINMGHEDTVVETLSNIEGQYLIASKTSSGWFLMTPTNGGKYYTATSSVSSTEEAVSCSDFYLVDNIEDYVWEVAKYESGYSIMSTNTNKYIGYKNSSNEAYANAELGEEVEMDIQLNGQSAVIESKNVSGRKLQYNANSPRFAFYTTTQTGVYMIPWVPDTTPRIFVSSVSLNVGADDMVVEFAYELRNAEGTPEVVVADGATMTDVNATAADGTLTVSFAANTEEVEKTATLVLSLDGATDVKVLITQAAWKDPNASGQETTVEKSSFTATAADMDNVISYETAQGGGTAAPAISGGEIRLYQNSAGTGGGTITISAADGYTLSSVTIGSSMATSVAYTIGDSTTKSSSSNLDGGGKCTVEDINASSITFYCMGTSKTSRLYINYLSATYTN